MKILLLITTLLKMMLIRTNQWCYSHNSLSTTLNNCLCLIELVKDRKEMGVERVKVKDL